MKARQQQLAAHAARKIKKIADAARGSFVDRDELIEAISYVMLAGELLVVLGPPGTGKSAAVRYFAAAAGLSFFRRVLNPDTMRDDLVGPIDPVGLQQGRWDRAWTGLATCKVAFLDEIGKASGQVANMLLDAMEERKVSSGNVDRDIPLHLVMAASNETVDESPAIWDRFTVRLVVHRLKRVSSLGHLLKDAWKVQDPPTIKIDDDEIEAARAECLRMAASAHEQPGVMRTVARLWDGVAQAAHEPVSARRWMRLLVVAAARALYYGRSAVEATDLQTAKWILWSDLDDIDPLNTMIAEVLDEERKELTTAAALVDDLEQLASPWIDNGNSPTDPQYVQDAGKVVYRCKSLVADIDHRLQDGAGSEWEVLKARLQALVSKTEVA
jgi:MoxR-like ATPase